MSDLVKNRKARHDYNVLETLEAGIELCGTEVKSCRERNINLSDGYAKVQDGEIWLHNVHISPYKAGNRQNHEPLRPRRLLLHKREIGACAQATQRRGLTLVPLAFYLKRGRIKVALGICEGRGKADKREAMREQDAKRRMQQAMRQRA